MISITPPPQIPKKVQETPISPKDRHDKHDHDFDLNKEKNKKDHEEVKDEITLSNEAKEEGKKPETKREPDSPLQGHIDIDV